LRSGGGGAEVVPFIGKEGPQKVLEKGSREGEVVGGRGGELAGSVAPFSKGGEEDTL